MSRKRTQRIDLARRAAYDIVHEVGAHRAHSNLVARRILAELSARDAAFATELAMGTLRHQGTLDEIIALFVSRELSSLDPRLLDILRLGTYQVLHMSTPAHAAVDSSVTLTRSVVGARPTGLVNAVMRKIAALPPDWVDQQADERDEASALAFRYAHPPWIVTAFRDALSEKSDELEDLLTSNNTPPQVTLVARPGVCAVEDLDRQDPTLTPGRWSPYARLMTSGRPGDLPAVHNQTAGVQDEASQIIAATFASLPVEGPETWWLDMCAGPGGKAALLAALSPGAHLLAADVSGVRASLVASSLAPFPHASVIAADGTTKPWRPVFDRVLLDAPCTGLGVIRRRAESRWRRTPEDVATLSELQRALLHAALDSVRVGGILGYVTCSPHLAETDQIVDTVLGERTDIRERDLHPYFPSEMAAGTTRIRTWPHRHGTDGMFFACLEKTDDHNDPPDTTIE